MGRLLRRMAHRLIRGLVRPRGLGLLLVVLALFGGIGLLTQSVKTAGAGLELPGPRRAPDSTESFLKAQQSGDADLMLNSLSDDALQRYRQRGGSAQQFQHQFSLARASGQQLEQFNYVGGHGLPDGTSLQFYVATTRGQTRPEPEHVTYIFTLDRSGKISRVQ